MKIVTVRDEASKTILQKMGLDNIHVVPDPVFGLRTAKTPHHPGGGERKRYAVFSLRPWIKDADKNRQVVAEFVDWLYETYHLKTYFVPFQSFRDDDEKEILKVFSKLEQHGSGEVLSPNECINDILKLVKEATLVVGMRLHSIIFSAITSTPFLALSYSLKVAEITRQLDMEEFLSEYRFIDLEELKHKFKKLFGERVRIEKKLAHMHEELERRTGEYVTLLRELCP